MALPLRVTVLPALYPFSATISPSLSRLQGYSRRSAADSTSQQHPRRPSVAAPLRMELKVGAAVAATAAAAATSYDASG